MAIFGLTMYPSSGLIGKQDTVNFAQQLNNKYRTTLRVRSSNTITSAMKSQNTTKPAVAISPDFLKKAMTSEELAEVLDKNLSKLGKASKEFQAMRSYGDKIAIQGYTVDAKGNITCVGVDRNNNETTYELGNIKDKETNFIDLLCDAFGFTRRDLMVANYKSTL